jgi:hypothetical protein
MSFLKKPIDSFYPQQAYNDMRNYFLKSEWNKVHDFIEFFCIYIQKIKSYLRNNKQLNESNTFDSFNKILENEFSGYRFINGIIAPITNSYEIEQIEDARTKTKQFTSFEGCNIHLTQALIFLSDRINPDYRNSVKESISAIESLMKTITQCNSFAGALDLLSKELNIHSALKEAFKKIMFISGAGGIRHAFYESNEPCEQKDAIFMLVSCSGFINFLIVKLQKSEKYQLTYR